MKFQKINRHESGRWKNPEVAAISRNFQKSSKKSLKSKEFLEFYARFKSENKDSKNLCQTKLISTEFQCIWELSWFSDTLTDTLTDWRQIRGVCTSSPSAISKKNLDSCVGDTFNARDDTIPCKGVGVGQGVGGGRGEGGEGEVRGRGVYRGRGKAEANLGTN